MNDLNIRERRKILGLTQEELAKLLGVSRRTVINYENGEVIPESKRELLHKILKVGHHNFSEPEVIYNKELSGFEKKIQQLEERIKEHSAIIELLPPKSSEILHHSEIVKLLNTQINLIKAAKEDKEKDN